MREIKVTQEEFNTARRIFNLVEETGTAVQTTVSRNFAGTGYSMDRSARPFGLWRRNEKGKILWRFEFFSHNPLAQPCGQIRGDEQRFRLDMTAAKMFFK